MNIYFLHAKHFRPEHFLHFMFKLKVKEVFLLDKELPDEIRDICKLNTKFSSYVPKDESALVGRCNACVYRFTDRLIDSEGLLLDKYNNSTDDFLSNLNNKTLDEDPNLLILIPEYEHRISIQRGRIYGLSDIPKKIAGYILNKLRYMSDDDKYANRIGFAWLDSHLSTTAVTAKGREIMTRRIGTLLDFNSYLFKATFPKSIKRNETKRLQKYYILKQSLKEFEQSMAIERERVVQIRAEREEREEARWRAEKEREEGMGDYEEWLEDMKDELNYILSNGGDWIEY